MKIFAVSDIHVDYEENMQWVCGLSKQAYREDILILGGDLTDNLQSFEKTLYELRRRFREVLYIPGNHDLWIRRERDMDSLEKLGLIKAIARNNGIRMEPYSIGTVSIVPLYGWYDYSFGMPSEMILDAWVDYIACKWPQDIDQKAITKHFTEMNKDWLSIKNEFIISFSHFLPRIDVMPAYIPPERRELYPVLGSAVLGEQVDKLKPQIHIYGHSHVNMDIIKDNTRYINNAFGYPTEKRITSKQLKCIYEA